MSALPSLLATATCQSVDLRCTKCIIITRFTKGYRLLLQSDSMCGIRAVVAGQDVDSIAFNATSEKGIYCRPPVMNSPTAGSQQRQWEITNGLLRPRGIDKCLNCIGCKLHKLPHKKSRSSTSTWVHLIIRRQSTTENFNDQT